MQVSTGGSHVHHHGLLAGIGAGTAGVLAVFGLLLMAWRSIGHAVGTAGTVIVWALTALVVAGAAYGVVFLVLRLRHHVTHPETLIRQAVRAEVVPGQVEPPGIHAVPAATPVAALPPGWRVLPEDPEAAIAAIRAIAGQR
jgi:hypothetical protein